MTGDACGGRLCVETVVCLPMTFNIYQVWRRRWAYLDLGPHTCTP